MRVFIVTDTHFGHENVIKYENRPENFNELIMKYWTEMVHPDDIVIHLGDVAFTTSDCWPDYIPKLPGRKILVKGNHDKKSWIWYMKNGFDFCCDTFSLRYYGKHILFTHIPVRYIPVTYDLNIHGHVHTKRKKFLVEKQIAVRLEENQYKPVLLSSIIY
jgi:calcineurin-like phosphoesterase family protein